MAAPNQLSFHGQTFFVQIGLRPLITAVTGSAKDGFCW